jgi:hypothetical protein
MSFIPAVTGDSDADDTAIRVFLATNYDQSYPPSILGGTAPVLTSMNAPWLSPDFEQAVIVTGTGFTAATKIHVDGAVVPTTFNSDTSVTFTIDPPTPNVTLAVTARNGSAESNALSIPVGAPNPTLTSISPNTATAGDPTVTVTFTGTNFTSGQTVARVNGASRPTTVVSATSLTATVLASSMTAPGTLNLDVSTPPPGGGNSTAQTFTVT